MALKLDKDERAVLEVYAALEDQDAEGAWCWYYPDVSGSSPFAEVVVKRLKKRGLLQTGDKRVNRDSSYWITDLGKETLK